MIYFDHAATSYPKPHAVLSAHARALRDFGGNPGRGAHRLSLAAAEMIYECRCRIADFFGVAEPERVVFTAGATAALNLAIHRRVRRGMHVLISDREHNAVARPIFALAEQGIITYDTYPASGDVEGGIRERLRQDTGLIVACHASNVTGRAVPLAAISLLCCERGIPLIVDAAQSAGHRRIDLNATPCDALCFPAHKGLLGAAGLGVAILSDSAGEPLILGGSGVDSLRREMPELLPERFEAGTLPTPAIAALLAGVKYLDTVGIDSVTLREEQLHKTLTEGLSVMNGIQLYEPECIGSVVSFTHRAYAPEEIAARLDRAGVMSRAGYHCAPLAHRAIGTPKGGCVRISTGYSNTERDALRFLRILEGCLRTTE